MASCVFASGSAFPHGRFARRNSRARCSSQSSSAQTGSGQQQIKWWQTKLAATIGGVTTVGGGVATGYKVVQQWHRVDKLAEDLASLKEGVDKRFDGVDKRFDKQDKKLDKILELLEESNKQHMTTREQFVKMRRRMDKTDLRVSVLEKNV